MTPDHAAEIALLIASDAQRQALEHPEPEDDHDDEVFDDDWSLLPSPPRRHFSGRPFLKYPNGDA